MTSTPSIQRSIRSIPWQWWTIGLILLLVVAAGLTIRNRQQRRQQAPTTVVVTSGPITARVVGSGNIVPAQALDLPFQIGGRVAELLVAEGDVVKADQPLARLDDRDLQLQVTSAQASLMSAQARLAQSQQGNATPEQLAAADAALQAAQANLTKARTGNVTGADIAGAEAALQAAQARLNALRQPTAEDVRLAEISVNSAQTNLQSTRDSASIAKTKAGSDLEQATYALVQAQSTYATARGNWEEVQETGRDPNRAETTNQTTGVTQSNDVTDGQRRSYYDAYVRAEAALRTAEQTVQQAQVAYDSARQQEITAVQQAEGQLATAQQQLSALLNPNPSSVAQAQADVQQAQAQLTKLRQGGTAADIAAAQANVQQQEAQRQQLTSPATSTDIEVQRALVIQAEEALKQAQFNQEKATLAAPFAGVVASLAMVPGSVVTPSMPVISLVDRSTLSVDLKLSESDVAQVQISQPVTMTIDALPGWSGSGTITYVAPAAENVNGVVTYRVRASFPDTEGRVKVGMTANLTIVTNQKDAVLLVPNTALLPQGASHVLQVVGADGKISEVPVTIGLTDGTQTEVTSGVQAGDRVVQVPLTSLPTSSGGFFGLRR